MFIKGLILNKLFIYLCPCPSNFQNRVPTKNSTDVKLEDKCWLKSIQVACLISSSEKGHHCNKYLAVWTKNALTDV